VSFASEPERDDGSLPPVNIVVPDDARELDRDVLAYRREIRALRRRQRRRRLLRPFSGPGGSGPAALVPLIALCLALALVGGALLSVLTISPAEQDNALTPTATPRATASPPRATAIPPRATASPSPLTALPQGTVQLDGKTSEPVQSLVGSAIALVPKDCACGQSLTLLTLQAHAAGAHVYFVGTGVPTAQLIGEAVKYGKGYATAATDPDGVLARAYHPTPTGLTVLLVFNDAKAEVRKNLSGHFQLGLTPGELNRPSSNADPRPSARANPTAGQRAG
jgi:hypothetical protein